MAAMLEVQGVSKSFGGVAANQAISLDVEAGKYVSCKRPIIGGEDVREDAGGGVRWRGGRAIPRGKFYISPAPD